MNSMLMSRRSFSFMGLSAAFATRGSSESSRVLSPENLEEAMPSSQPAPRACAELPLIPPPPSELTVQQLFPGFKSQFLKTSSATIRVLTKGDGPPFFCCTDTQRPT
jgi:hypothetical protein